MQSEQINSAILEAPGYIQTASGREWKPLSPESKPLGDLDGFDSLSAVEVTVAIEQNSDANWALNRFLHQMMERAL
jgi:acyl carrier protein